MYYILCVTLLQEHFTDIVSFDHLLILSGMCYHYSHFTDEETKSQKAFLLSPMSQISSKRKLEYKPRSRYLSVVSVLIHFAIPTFNKITVPSL